MLQRYDLSLLPDIGKMIFVQGCFQQNASLRKDRHRFFFHKQVLFYSIRINQGMGCGMNRQKKEKRTFTKYQTAHCNKEAYF